jgi:hypothetical protein
MKRSILALAAASLLAACGDRAPDAQPAADSAATTAIPGYDPDTTMAPPPAMDSSMRPAVPATDTVAGIRE